MFLLSIGSELTAAWWRVESVTLQPQTGHQLFIACEDKQAQDSYEQILELGVVIQNYGDLPNIR